MVKQPDPTQYSQIFHLLDRAFAPSITESNLIRSLRENGKKFIDFVIEKDGKVLAYICYTAACDIRKTKIGYHLAPLAVLPGKQGQGLGTRIVLESLKQLPQGRPVYVLGDPAYYKRFGFRLDTTQKCRFDPEGDHFMVLFAGPLPEREVTYEEEFFEPG